MIDGKYGYINKNGEIGIEPKYSDAGHFSEGLSYVRTGDKYGYIDKNENITIKEQFNIAKEFKCGRARVFNGTKWYFIDKDGKRTSEYFEQVYDYSENVAIVQ